MIKELMSERMIAVANLLDEHEVVADVGCDHAYVSMYLLEQKLANKTIAMDVRKGPLEIAKKNIESHCMEDRIDIRLSDGLEKLEPKEANACVIAGMGGPLIIKILKQNLERAKEMDELILQPQSELDVVRNFLQEEGFMIEKEIMVYEQDKYYTAMKVKKGKMELKHVEKLYGPYLLSHRHPLLKEYLEREWITLLQIKEQLEKNQDSEKAKLALKVLKHRMHWNKGAYHYYEV